MQSRQSRAGAHLALQLGGDAEEPIPATESDRSIQLGLLGSLSLTRGDQLITPSAPKLRQVLSLLAVQANSVTRVDQLVEELWEESPPPSALTTVQTYIYQLRKLLRLDDKLPAEPDRPALVSHPGGYILRLPELADIDANLFEQLAQRGRRELLSVRVEAAAETFRDALSLWRGRFLEGVSTGPLLYAHATRLEELKRTALALRIEADLQLGRHQEIIDELASLVSAEPTREDFSAKLMVALYRSGRRADALGVYQRIRTTLADELGLDPATELQRLHQLMLEADPELDLPTGVKPVVQAAPRSAPVPAQLPADLADFVGRQQETERLTGLLAAGDVRGLQVINVVGRPGVGKSAFVTRAARAVRAHYPDGQLCVDLTGGDGRPMPTRQILVGMLRALGVDEGDIPETLGETALMFRSATADRRLLVVLDRAGATDSVQYLLPGGSGCAVVVLSRAPVRALPGAVRLRVPPLPADEAVELLATILGAERVVEEPADAARLVELCDRLPLALRAIAAKLAARPSWRLSRMVARLVEDRDRRAELCYGGFDVLGLLADEYQTLTARQRWVFRQLAASDEPLTADEVAERVSMSAGAVRMVLDELVDADLVEERENGAAEPTNVVPSLIRLVAAAAVSSSWWRTTAGH